jgi:4-hydroxythreonine-4-phosphate dehydrogenase
VSDDTRPRIAITLGDVAGIGPEVVVRALGSEAVAACCRPLVIGDRRLLDRTAAQVVRLAMSDWRRILPDEALSDVLAGSLDDVVPGTIDPRCGQAAFTWLETGITLALNGEVAALVTAPLSKAALHAAGHPYPGHTEILAERCGVRDFAMMLYLPGGADVRGPHGLAVSHVTLHTSIASVPGLLSQERISETIGLTETFLRRVGCTPPRIGVCALNPHAGEEGLFGDEESRRIRPAVLDARSRGVHCSGPFPADTLFRRAADGEFDGVVAMYHDQGHIALKLLGFGRAVNVTLGLPIVRTSPSHGTAFDIAGQGKADPAGMIAAIRVAAQLAGEGCPSIGS